jgi:hypothetical protein
MGRADFDRPPGQNVQPAISIGSARENKRVNVPAGVDHRQPQIEV